MSDAVIDILLFVILFGLPLYLMFGMTKGSNGDYGLKGWFFVPARLFKKLLCGMFMGHKYINGQCVYCLKERKEK